jgi:polysaccharide biosynthesis protein PslG
MASLLVLTVQPSLSRAARDDLYVGVTIAGISPESVQSAREAGFGYMRHTLEWQSIDQSGGQFPWERDEPNHLDNVVGAAAQGGVGLVLRLDGGPRHAGGVAPAATSEEVAEFYRAVAARAYPHLVAVEVLNEPNLPPEWGGDADPGGYVSFLRAAHDGIKSVTPDVLIIAANLSPAPNGPGTMDDLEFLRQMYAAGARGSYDVIGIHNYGGNTEPELDPSECVICFRRAELYRQIMEENGDGDTPIWATETGWLLGTDVDLAHFNWMKVSAEQQGAYLVRAIQYASENWPWLQGIMVFNLDHSTAPWHGPETSMYWFSLINPDRSHRYAYEAVQEALQ